VSAGVNRYAAPCASCGARVPARGGALLEGPRRSWQVFHLTCADGAPGPRVVETRSGNGQTFIRNARGRCEDAPCCGCCTF
jgi:hypothetical protein